MIRKTLPDLGLAILLLLLPLLIFAPVALGPKTLVPADILYAHEPHRTAAGDTFDDFHIAHPQNHLVADLVLQNYAWKQFILDAIQDRQLPLWDPYIFAGHPFLANGQHSALYPLSTLFYVMPLWRAYGVFAWLQLGLAGCFAYFFVRVLGGRRLGGLIAGITYQFCGFMAISAVPHPMIVAGASWLPFILAMVELMIQQRPLVREQPTTLPWALLGAVGLGCQMLVGHVENTYFLLLVTGAYAAWRLGYTWLHTLRREGRPRKAHALLRPLARPILWLALLLVLGLALGAVQFVPMWEVANDSFRSGEAAASLEQVRGWAYPPRRVITFGVPNFFGNPAHHTYFDLFTGRWTPAPDRGDGQYIDWGMKNYVEGAAYLGLLPLFLSLIAVLHRYTSIPVYRSTNLPALLCILWGAGVVLPWALSWARDTWSSQGRLIFSAISTWSLLLAWGVASWWPRRWQKWALGGLAAFLLALTAAAPWVWIRPAYALPEPLTEAQVEAIPHQLRVDFGLPGAEIPVMRLLGYGLEQDVVQPGGEAAVTLYWETVASADKDYTVFVHLVDDLNMVVAQRDTYPGLGTLSTQWLTPGFRWRDRYVLRVPETAYAPNAARTEARIEVGLYDRVTGMRLETGTAPALETGVDENILGDHVAFGRIAIKPRPGEYPNPTFVNLGDRMALVGYDLDRRAARPGETVTLTLYWRGLRTMETSYTVSVQLIDHAQRKAAQHDGPPLGGEAPTSTWEPGQTLVDPYHLKIAPDASPGVYRVQVVVYTFDEDGEIAPLPTVPEGGEMQARQVTLTTVRVSE